MAMTGEHRSVPFALGTFSVSGSPGFVALVFEDGATVSLHAVLPLAAKLGLHLGDMTSLFDLLQDWDRNFATLCRLADCLAYDDAANGYRGDFTSEDFLHALKPLRGTRQIFRALAGADTFMSVPTTVLGDPADPILLSDELRQLKPNFCLAAIFGRMGRNMSAEQSENSIAGYMMATELVRSDMNSGMGRLSAPGTLITGPLFVPQAFLRDFVSMQFMIALNGDEIQRDTLARMADGVFKKASELSHRVLLLPGDVLLTGLADKPETQAVVEGDILETIASGFGRQHINIQQRNA